MSDEKVVKLGGGSPFVPSIIYAMLENKEVLEGCELCLMDIDPTHLPILTELGQKLSERAKIKMKFKWTTNAREALEGATFVIPSYRIGGEKHMKYDLIIPTKCGICGDAASISSHTFFSLDMV